MVVAGCSVLVLAAPATARGAAPSEGATVVTSNPTAGETLATFPGELSVTFTDPVRADVELRALDADGRAVALDPAVVDADQRTARAAVIDPPDGDGTFVVSWTANAATAGDDGGDDAADDEHSPSGSALNGGYLFSVAASGQKVVEANARVDAGSGIDVVRVAGGVVFAVGAVLLVLSLVLVRQAGPAPRRWLLPLGGVLMFAGVAILVTGALGDEGAASTPVEVRATGDGVVDLTVTPAVVGLNEVHLYVYDDDDRPLEVDELTLTVTRREGDIVAVAVPVVRAGPNHFLAYEAPLLFPGTYDLAVGGTSVDGAPVGAVATVEVP